MITDGYLYQIKNSEGHLLSGARWSKNCWHAIWSSDGHNYYHRRNYAMEMINRFPDLKLTLITYDIVKKNEVVKN